MIHHAKFHHDRLNGFGDIAIFRFSRWPPSTMLDFQILNLWSPLGLKWLMCIAIQISLKSAEWSWDIAFNNFQNGSHPPSWIFKHLIFWIAGKLSRTNTCHHVKFHENEPNGYGYIVIFWFSGWPPSTILEFQILKFLVDHQIGRPNMHCHTKFHQNQSNGWCDITFNIFKMAAVRHRVFLKIWFFEQHLAFGGRICISMQNFVEIGGTVAEI